jgi:hypothetical protein
MVLEQKQSPMWRFGYARYVAQNGGSETPISGAMTREVIAGLLGTYIRSPVTVPTCLIAADGNGLRNKVSLATSSSPLRASAGRSSGTALFIL